MNPAFHDVGEFRRGAETWLVFGAVYVMPASAQAPKLANRALQLVNEVRARGARCGERSFGPAPPMKLSDTLGTVAFGHANDMARHNYFEHEDLTGHSPADRVRAVGYREKLVGENIAYGPKSAEEVVQGWPLRKHHGSASRGNGNCVCGRSIRPARSILGPVAGGAEGLTALAAPKPVLEVRPL
jgi:hypothetical protein